MLKKDALIIDGGARRFAHIEDRLTELNFNISKTVDPSWVPKFAEATSQIAVLVVDETIISTEQRRELLEAFNQFQNDTPILWATDIQKSAPATIAEISQSTISLEGKPDQELKMLNQVIKERFFPKIVAYAFEFSTKLAMLQTLHFEPQSIRSYIRADNTSLAQVNAVIPFAGRGASGCLSLSASRQTLERVSQTLETPTKSDHKSRATELVGESSAAIMGRFKAFLEQNQLQVKVSWPLVTEGFPTSLTYGAGRLTLVEELSRGPDQLFVELCLDSFDRAAIRHKIAPPGKKPGELTFL